MGWSKATGAAVIAFPVAQGVTRVRWLAGKSLVLRLALAFSLIIGFAVFLIVSSMFAAERLRGAGTAINFAGTLRYSSYDASTSALRPAAAAAPWHNAPLWAAIERFEQHYTSDALLKWVPAESQDPTHLAYEEVGRLWFETVRPLLLDSAQRTLDPEFYHELRSVVDDFVFRVDRFVVLLEQRAEYWIQHLRMLQFLALILTLLVAIATVRFFWRDVIRPLRDLLAGAQAVGRGQFDYRIAHTGPDELGQLGRVFNGMARDLSELYGDLERRVGAKTRALELSNQSLELMYRSLSQVDAAAAPRSRFAETLRELEQMLGLESESLTLLQWEIQADGRLLEQEKIPGCPGRVCASYSSCKECIAAMGPGLRDFSEPGRNPLFAIPLLEANEILGLLQIQLPQGVQLLPWQVQLMEAVARHLGLAIANERSMIRSRRLALLEERTTIARELHDSLAQTLSYLKIEFSLLRSALQTPARHDHVPGILEDLQEGLNEAYTHLRSLLTTFRMGHSGLGLQRSLEQVVRNVEAHGVLEVQLHNAIADGELTSPEETNLVHIAREALCNVHRHAQARQVRLQLARTADGAIRMTIADDGIGLAADAGDKPGHYGLLTMRERADQLRGVLTVAPGSAAGTEVGLVFRPVPPGNPGVPPVRVSAWVGGS